VAVEVRDYLANLPLLHTWDGGKTWNTGGFGPDHLGKILEFFGAHAPPRPAILETGAGNSTLAFLLLRPSSLVSICPEQPLFDRIRKFAVEHAFELGPWTTYVDGSEWMLPKLADLSRASGPTLDIALVDGCHNWPMVFVDFCYVHYLLRTGGHLILDDLQLHSVKELARLLAEGDEYERVLDLGKAVVYRKRTASRDMPEWNAERYVLRKTDEYAKRPDPFALT
jgi:hypothetical protein